MGFTARKRGAPIGTRTLALLSLMSLVGIEEAYSQAKPPFKIAIISELSGSTAVAIGKDTALGLETYLKALNDRGGVNGRKIDFGTTIDTQGNPTGAVAAIRRALESKPSLIVGYLISGNGVATMPLLEQAGVPTILVSAASDEYLAPHPKSWLFQVIGGPRIASRAMTTEFQKLLGGSLAGKKFGLIAIDTPFSGTQMDVSAARIKSAGGDVVFMQRAAMTQIDFASQANAIAAAKPDGVGMYLVGSGQVQFAKALEVAGYKGPIVSGQNGSTEGIINTIGQANYYALRWSPLDVNNIVSPIVQKYGSPALTAANDPSYGWIEGAVVEEALKGCASDPCSASEIQARLEKNPVSAPGVYLGPVVYSAVDHEGKRTVQYVTYDPNTKKAVPSGEPFVVDPSAE